MLRAQAEPHQHQHERHFNQHADNGRKRRARGKAIEHRSRRYGNLKMI